MTDKTWTATDLELGKLTVIRRGSTLQIERRYKFLDSGGSVLEQIAGGRLLLDMEWSTIPTNIQDALTIIDTWTKNQSLVQEDMD